MFKKNKPKARNIEDKSSPRERFFARNPFVILARKKRNRRYDNRDTLARSVSLRKVI